MRKIFYIIMFVLGFFCVLYLQFGRAPYMNNITSTKESQNYESNITITLQTLIVLDCNDVKENIIRMISKNSFENIKISDEVLSGPSSLKITVYANNFTRYLNIPAFAFEYSIKTDLS